MLANKKNGKITKENIKNPGDLINTDQVESSTPGRPLTYSGYNNLNKITTVTIFVDSLSKKKFAKFQTSTPSALTIQSKVQMEREAKCFNVTIKCIRADNSTFYSKEFQDHIESLEQDITFCGVSAHHHNGIAECHIRTLVASTCTSLLNAHVQWPQAIDMELWTFAFKHTVNQWNNTPWKDLWYLTPDKEFVGITNTSTSKRDTFCHFHPFGGLVYVVDSTITDDRKIQKWDPCSRVGIYLGCSCNHTGSIAWILNPCTDHISAQFHTIFDNTFSTVNPTSDASAINI
eukprot:1054652-Ditylum_brightwellii.AAC.1